LTITADESGPDPLRRTFRRPQLERKEDSFIGGEGGEMIHRDFAEGSAFLKTRNYGGEKYTVGGCARRGGWGNDLQRSIQLLKVIAFIVQKVKR